MPFRYCFREKDLEPKAKDSPEEKQQKEEASQKYRPPLNPLPILPQNTLIPSLCEFDVLYIFLSFVK